MQVIIRRFGNYINLVERDMLSVWIADNIPSEDGGKLNALLQEQKLIDYAKTKNYSFEVTGNIN